MEKNAISTLKVKQPSVFFVCFLTVTQVLCVNENARSERNPRKTDLRVAQEHACPRQTCTYIQYDNMINMIHTHAHTHTRTRASAL